MDLETLRNTTLNRLSLSLTETNLNAYAQIIPVQCCATSIQEQDFLVPVFGRIQSPTTENARALVMKLEEASLAAHMRKGY